MRSISEIETEVSRKIQGWDRNKLYKLARGAHIRNCLVNTFSTEEAPIVEAALDRLVNTFKPDV